MSAEEMETGSDLELLQQCEDCLGQGKMQDIVKPDDASIKTTPIESCAALKELDVVATSCSPVPTGRATFSLTALFNHLQGEVRK
jgi:hypothetical protein